MFFCYLTGSRGYFLSLEQVDMIWVSEEVVTCKLGIEMAPKEVIHLQGGLQAQVVRVVFQAHQVRVLVVLTVQVAVQVAVLLLGLR